MEAGLNSPLLRFVSIPLVVLALSAPTPAKAQLKLLADHPISLHGGEGAVTFTLKNTGASAVPLALTAGPVVDAATHTVILRAKTVLSPVVAATTATSIAPGDSLAYQAAVTGVSGASSAQLDLFNAATNLGELSLVEVDAPLGITIDGDGAPDNPLAFVWNEPVTITLKNNDPQSYHVHWSLQLAGKQEGKGELDIAPNGASRITVIPTSDVFSIYDRLHPSAKQGVLLLSTDSSANLPAGLLPSRMLPVDLLMRRVSSSASTLFSYVYAGIFLLLGGILSIVASSVLPNMQRKVELRAQLKDLANRTTSVSTRIDSYLRVLLRLERKRVEIAIGEISAWLPASGDPLSQVSTGIAMLDKRLTAAEHLDDLRRKHEQASATAPPSVSENIDAALQLAAGQLHSLNLSDADLLAANGALLKAESTLATLDDDAALAKLIAANVTALNARIAKFPLEYASDLKAALPGIWVILDRGLDDPKNIVRPMFFSIDHGVAAIHLAFDYAMVRASVPAGDDPSCTDPGKTVRARLAQRHCHLVDLLGTLSWRALREATNLVAQMREDIYEEDVIVEIAKPGQAELTYDTQKPRPFLPVFFSINFKDSPFNGAAALQRMICHWSFPDGLQEYGWRVCHYFSGNEKANPAPPLKSAGSSAQHPATAKPEAPKVAPQGIVHIDDAHPSHHWRLPFFHHKAAPPRTVTLAITAVIRGQKAEESKEFPRPPLNSSLQIQRVAPKESTRFLAEFLRFIIAFGVALAGLLSGALGQLEKLDLIPATVAILALGFGADSIKNLLTQAPKKN